jgi:hypothetical protein
MLSNKRILFICTPLHELHEKIKEAIESLNGSVDLFLIENRSIFTTFLLNVNIHLYKKYRRYQQNLILDKIKHVTYNIIFIQYPYLLSLEFFRVLKNNQQAARFINYNWDSIKSRDYTSYIDFFDKVFSFDSNDCLINSKVKYLPLFYSNDFNRQPKKEKKYDLIFIGGFGDTENRYEFIRSIEKLCKNYHLIFHKYLYCSINYFLKSLLKGKIYTGVRFRKLKLAEMARLYNESYCAIDYHNPNQKGLSMRTFEVLGSGCKLMTTNKNILSEEFMNPEIICIIEKNNPEINKEFILKDISDEYSFEEYSLNNWIIKIFSD